MEMIVDLYEGLKPFNTVIGAVILSLLFLWASWHLIYYPLRHVLIAWSICRCLYRVEKVHGAEKGMVKEKARKKYPRFYKAHTCLQIIRSYKLAFIYTQASSLDAETHAINFKPFFPHVTIKGKFVDGQSIPDTKEESGNS